MKYCDVLSYNTGLCPPYAVNHSIVGDYVLIKWKHSHSKEPLHGYYVSVQEVLNKKRLGSPDFVYVEQDVHSTRIQGLKPDAVYEMKVQQNEEYSSSTLLYH